MKKILVLMLIAVAAITASAQSQNHLKFQGIPIDGTFAQVEAKLKAKGWKYDYEASKKVDADTRIYIGEFGGKRGRLWVDRTPISKKVFAIHFYNDEVYSYEISEAKAEIYIEAIRRTYPAAHEWRNDNDNIQFDLDDGHIVCGVLKLSHGTYSAFITYVDLANQQKYLKEEDADY